MTRRIAPWGAVAVAVAVATALRVSLIHAGPDFEYDAFRHAYIARRLLTEWRDLRHHWVWLPLWHALGVVGYLVGGGHAALRWVSVVASGAAPFALTGYLRRACGDGDPAIPTAAGVCLALWPAEVTMGASGEPEALFQLMVIVALWSWHARRIAMTAATLALASLLRYEAWAVLAVFGALWFTEGRRARDAWVWALPCAAIGLWLGAQAWQHGDPLWFVAENRRYVLSAWRENQLGDAVERVAHPYTWYALRVPWRSLHGLLGLALFGVPWAWRDAPRAFRWTFVALLAFVTWVWVRRANLGLERHFVAVIPLYAAAMGAGYAAVSSWLAPRLRSVAWARAVVAVVALGYLGAYRIPPWMRRYREYIARQSSAGEALGALVHANLGGDRTRLWCDDLTYETYADMAPWRVVRWDGRDVHDFNLRVEVAQRGRVLVIMHPSKAAQLHEDITVLYRGDQVVLLRRDARPNMPEAR